MPEQFRLFDNPAYGNVASQTVDINVPSEGEYFINKAGGQDQLYQRRGNELIGLGYTPPPLTGGPGGERDWQGRTIGSYQNEATAKAISQLGLKDIQEFRSPDIADWMKKSGVTKKVIQDFDEFLGGAIQPTSQFSQNIVKGLSDKPRIEIPSSNQWVDPTTGQQTPAGIGMPQASTSTKQDTSKIPFISSMTPEQKSGIENLVTNKPYAQWNDTDKANWNTATGGAWVNAVDQQGNQVKVPAGINVPGMGLATNLTSPTGETKTVGIGSPEANSLLNSGWTTGGQMSDDVTSSMLAGQSQIELPSGFTSAGSSPADIMKGGIVSTSQSADEWIKNMQELLTPKATDTSRELDNIRGLLGDSIESLEGRGAAQLAEEERRGIEDKMENLASKNTALKRKVAEIQALESSYNLENQREEGRPQTLSRLQGAQAQNYKMYLAQKNMLTAEAGYIQAEMLGLQGEVEAAQNAANRAVDLEYADRESRYNSLLAQSQLLEKQVDGDEARYTQAVGMFLEQQQALLQEEKEMKKAELEAQFAELDTQVVTAGGRQLLVNKQTGETIRDLGSAYKTTGGGGGGVSYGITDEQEYQIQQALGSEVGIDNYVSPDDYNLAKRDWITAGGNPTDFDKKMAGFRNPSNPYYLGSETATTNSSNRTY